MKRFFTLRNALYLVVPVASFGIGWSVKPSLKTVTLTLTDTQVMIKDSTISSAYIYANSLSNCVVSSNSVRVASSTNNYVTTVSGTTK